MSLLFDQLYNRVKNHLQETFNTSFVGFSKLGIEIDIDEATDYINNIIVEVEKKDDDNKTHSDYLTLAFCYFAISLIVKYDEEMFEDVEEGE
jgi:hypothetical protein